MSTEETIIKDKMVLVWVKKHGQFDFYYAHEKMRRQVNVTKVLERVTRVLTTSR